MLNYHVVLDVLQSGVQQTVTGFYCGDTEKKQLCITLVRQGVRYDIPAGASAAFTAVKPDQTEVSHPCTLTEGQIFYVPTEQTLAAEGVVHCQIIIYGLDHSVLFSPKFDLSVEQALVGEEPAASADSFTFLPVSVLSNLADADGTLTYQDHAIGGVAVVQTYYDLPIGCTGQLVYVRTGDSTHPRGFYRFGSQWENLSVDTHAHANYPALQGLEMRNYFLCVGNQAVGRLLTVQDAAQLPPAVPDGILAYEKNTRLLMRRENGEWYTLFNGAQAHAHANSAVLAKLSEDAKGNPLYDGKPIASGDDDTLIPLQLGETYDTLSIREDWQDVPVFVLDDVFLLSLSDTSGSNSISLIESVDYDTGMPVQLLKVRLDGSLYACFPRDVQGIATFYEAGWYDENDDPCDAPTLANLTFDKLVVGSSTYTDLADLPPKAQSALETLSRMVNVSAEAMGGITVPDGAVMRFAGTLQPDRHYDFIAEIPFTLTLPESTFNGKSRSITLDLHCAVQNVTMTLPREKLLDNGVLPDTRQGHHTLTFTYIPDAGKWSVGCVNRVQPQYWDDIPDEVTALEDCTWAQIKSIGEHGYKNRFGQWCIRRNNVEEVWFEVGDTKTVALTGGETWTMLLAGLQIDNLADGSGKAPFTFVMNGLTASTYQMNASGTVNGGWEVCDCRRVTMPALLAKLPSGLQTVLAEVSKIFASGSYSNLITTTDKLFVPSVKELTGQTPTSSDTAPNEDNKYPVFNTVSIATGTEYWTRTSTTDTTSSSQQNKWRYVTATGSCGKNVTVSAGTAKKIRVGFCV